MMQKECVLQTTAGTIKGVLKNGCRVFLGVPFAAAGRFEYSVPCETDSVIDATEFGPGCPQTRGIYEHLEHPTRRFYKKEYRASDVYRYDEQCLNLNIFAPDVADRAPVVLFFYGGGFNSGLNAENPFRGYGLAKRGVIAVFANYRVGVLGYFTHEEIEKRYGRDGNFGLDDQLAAIKWVKKHIALFGGDPENITLLGQSAGAMSIQYLSINPANRGLFRRAVMMSGAGLFPKFSLPRPAAKTHPYWEEFMKCVGAGTFEEVKSCPIDKLFGGIELIRTIRSDHQFNTMPVVDGVLIPKPVDELIRSPLPIDYLIGYTNHDMYAPVLTYISDRFAKETGAYVYYFDVDAPGDKNHAFHSADIRYLFETLSDSWRPYTPRDYEIAGQMADYLANFAKCGDPNGDGLPAWSRVRPHAAADVLRFTPKETKMSHPNYFKAAVRFISRPEPKDEQE